MFPALPTPPAAYPVLSDAKFLQLAAAYGTNSFIPERIKVELDENATKALTSLAAHEKYISHLSAAGKHIVTLAKDAVTKADSGSLADKQAALKMTFNAERELIKIAKLAHADHQAFDGAWNKFRAISISAHVPDLQPEFSANFIRVREKLMADGKLINVKVSKLAQLEVQAKAMTKLSAGRVGTGNTSAQKQLEEAQTAAANFAADVKEQVLKSMGNERLKPGSGGKNIGWYSVGTKLSTLQQNADKTTVSAQDLATSQQLYVNIQAAVKTYKATVKTLDTLLAVAERAIPVPLRTADGVAVHVAEAKKIIAEAAAVNKDALTLMAAAEKLITKTKKKVVKK